MKIEDKTLEPLLIAGIRTRGKYSECDKLFSTLGRRVGRHISGPGMNLYYDEEYREEDADFESCFPIRKPIDVEGVDIRELPGGRCLSYLHHGPYETLCESYEKIFDHSQSIGMQIKYPIREIYIKGSGMIFRGNPKKYITEIQFLFKD